MTENTNRSVSEGQKCFSAANMTTRPTVGIMDFFHRGEPEGWRGLKKLARGGEYAGRGWCGVIIIAIDKDK